uniref:Uncharacterized protein n=1 Tax=Palpitomonas bilix TaxID=652834 RepID=A0A7S3LSR5_9EUKA
MLYPIEVEVRREKEGIGYSRRAQKERERKVESAMKRERYRREVVDEKEVRREVRDGVENEHVRIGGRGREFGPPPPPPSHSSLPPPTSLLPRTSSSPPFFSHTQPSTGTKTSHHRYSSMPGQTHASVKGEADFQFTQFVSGGVQSFGV